MAHPPSIVVIPTYDRPESLLGVVDAVRGQLDDPILIFDDGSHLANAILYAQLCRKHKGMRYYRSGVNGGRRLWHKLIQWAVTELDRYAWDFVFFMQDDLSIEDDAFDRLFETWDRITEEADRKPGLLNAIWDSRCQDGNWGSGPPVWREHYWETGWTDMMFMAPRSTFEAIKWKIPVPSKNHFRRRQSSGVGMALGHLLNFMDIGMYHMPPGSSVWRHNDGPSMMHPVERKRNPIQSE